MLKKPTTRIKRILFIILFLLPRQYGLAAASCRIRTCTAFKSNLWRTYSIVCACLFLVVYPIAIITIQPKMKAISEGHIFVLIDITNYCLMYAFCVAVYLRVISSPTKLINFNNLNFTLFEECKALCKDRREIMFVLLFTTRILYLYLGTTVVNAITLVENEENLKNVSFIFKYTYLVPDLVMASEMIRFRSSIFMGIICCQRINQAFSECIDSLKTSKEKPADERFRIFFRAKHTFHKITDCHAKLYYLAKETEALSGNLLLFSILKAFAHLSTTVIRMKSIY